MKSTQIYVRSFDQTTEMDPGLHLKEEGLGGVRPLRPILPVAHTHLTWFQHVKQHGGTSTGIMDFPSWNHQGICSMNNS